MLPGESLGVEPGGGFALRDAKAVGDAEEPDGTTMPQHLHAERCLKETASVGGGVQRHREEEGDSPVQHLLHLLLSQLPETGKNPQYTDHPDEGNA